MKITPVEYLPGAGSERFNRFISEIIRSFVEKIEVIKAEKIPGTRKKKQTIVIYWNFIGAVNIPERHEKTA